MKSLDSISSYLRNLINHDENLLNLTIRAKLISYEKKSNFFEFEAIFNNEIIKFIIFESKLRPWYLKLPIGTEIEIFFSIKFYSRKHKLSYVVNKLKKIEFNDQENKINDNKNYLISNGYDKQNFKFHLFKKNHKKILFLHISENITKEIQHQININVPFIPNYTFIKINHKTIIKTINLKLEQKNIIEYDLIVLLLKNIDYQIYKYEFNDLTSSIKIFNLVSPFILLIDNFDHNQDLPNHSLVSAGFYNNVNSFIKFNFNSFSDSKTILENFKDNLRLTYDYIEKLRQDLLKLEKKLSNISFYLVNKKVEISLLKKELFKFKYEIINKINSLNKIQIKLYSSLRSKSILNNESFITSKGIYVKTNNKFKKFN